MHKLVLNANHIGQVAPDICPLTPMHPSKDEKTSALAVEHFQGAVDQVKDLLEGGAFDLWLAAKDGDIAAVLKILSIHPRVDWELQESDDQALIYKTRRVTSQAIHAAAHCKASATRSHGSHGSGHGHGSGSRRWSIPDLPSLDGERIERTLTTPSAIITKLLLDKSANVNAQARIGEDGDRQQRKLQAIHIAAGRGNVETIAVLIHHGALADAHATRGGNLHYMPLHDAAWFDCVPSVKCLLQHKARAEATNVEGDTALHIAAKLGYPETVKAILHQDKHKSDRSYHKECERLLKLNNKAKETPLDLAVKSGQYPPGWLHLFTNSLDEHGRVEAFVKVAHLCPAAAPALLRNECNTELALQKTDMKREWRDTLLMGARNQEIDITMFASLIENAPLAAVDLLDALTAEPEVECREHHPLPMRASIPQNNHFACRICCSYEEEKIWSCDTSQLGPPLYGGKPWHLTIAPKDPKHGQEVEVRVFMLKGIIDKYVFNQLSMTPAQQIFTRLVTHAIIKIAWGAYKWMFLLDLAHQLAATFVISYWCFSGNADPTNLFVRKFMWSIVASLGALECFLFIWNIVTWTIDMGKRKMLNFLSRTWYHGFLGALTVFLSVAMERNFAPDGNSSVILSLNSLAHWMRLLFELRAFEWTGRRLLPIMKSVLPIFHMLVIMTFLSMGFVHAYWAMERDNVSESSFFGTIVFIFTGESEIADDLKQLGGGEREFLLLLSLFGIVVVLAVMLNVFIAVLGDCYDQEQDKMICTYLQERAQICSMFFLRPALKIPILSPAWSREKRPKKKKIALYFGFWPVHLSFRKVCFQVLIVLFMVSCVVSLVVWALHATFSGWAAVLVISTSMLLIESLLKANLTDRWKKCYLWVCHEVNLEEGMFLAPEERRMVDHQGRMSELKKYVREQCKSTDRTCRQLKDTSDKLLSMLIAQEDKGYELPTKPRRRASTLRSCTPQEIESSEIVTHAPHRNGHTKDFSSSAETTIPSHSGQAEPDDRDEIGSGLEDDDDSCTEEVRNLKVQVKTLADRMEGLERAHRQSHESLDAKLTSIQEHMRAIHEAARRKKRTDRSGHDAGPDNAEHLEAQAPSLKTVHSGNVAGSGNVEHLETPAPTLKTGHSGSSGSGCAELSETLALSTRSISKTSRNGMAFASERSETLAPSLATASQKTDPSGLAHAADHVEHVETPAPSLPPNGLKEETFAAPTRVEAENHDV